MQIINEKASGLKAVLFAYGIDASSATMQPFGSGLINRTWKVSTPTKNYVLQQVNHDVFKNPERIAHNIHLIAKHLKNHHPEYCFVAPLTANDGTEMVKEPNEGFFRLFPFLEGSHSKDVVHSSAEAYEAAHQFGLFTWMLAGLNISDLQITIPAFHDLSLRFQQFLSAIENGNQLRRERCDSSIQKVLQYRDIVDQYEDMKNNPDFKQRVTHHDTKISNVLFDSNNKGICVIDLDTVMPGYFISDVGDMMRTYLSPVNEEEKDFSKIVVREDFYKAIVEGYFKEMKHELTEAEKGNFFYAGKFMIYMQALRFLTDHLNDDIYYGARYEGHNLMRAQNQLVLLKRLMEKESQLLNFC